MKQQSSPTYTEAEQAIIRAAAALHGRKGGAVTGPCKARSVSSEQARHAINTRWARYRAAQQSTAKPSK
jgi:hypothetical protein